MPSAPGATPEVAAACSAATNVQGARAEASDNSAVAHERSRIAPMLGRVISLLGALVFISAIHVMLVHQQVAEGWRFHGFEADRRLYGPELFHYALLLILGVPAALLFASAWSERAWLQACALVIRGGYWLPALIGGLACWSISRLVTHGAWFTDDEQAYLFQMHSYRNLAMSVPALQPEPLFHHPFVVVGEVRNGVELWTGIYPVLQPLLMLFSSLLGHPLLTQWLCVALIAYHAGRLTESLSGKRTLGIGAAWLCASSPTLIGLGSTYHTSVLATFLTVATLRACLWAGEQGSAARGALVGALAGATFLTRGLEGTVLVTVAAGALFWWCRASLRHALKILIAFSLTAASALAVFAFVNLATTGSWLDTTYAIWARQTGRIMGFGENMMWNRTHTPWDAVSQTVAMVTRINIWTFGWPVSVVVPLLGLLSGLRDRFVPWLLGLSALQLGAYAFLAFGSVHDFGTAYHVWHVPILAVVTVCVLARGRRLTAWAGRVAFSMTVVSLLAFWPMQLDKWRTTAAAILAPVEAAERAARGRKGFVLWRSVKVPGVGSWVHSPPAPFPDNPIIWVKDVAGAPEVLRSRYPDRVILRLSWRDGIPIVTAAGAVADPLTVHEQRRGRAASAPRG